MATIYDAARRAGVTAATVSYVVNGKRRVGEETRARVLAALEEVGYRPNLLARGLARRRISTVALLLPSIADSFYPEIALEVERVARERGYHLLLCNTRYDTRLGRTHLDSLSGHLVDGILAMAGGLDLDDVVIAHAHGVPVVLCNWCNRTDRHYDDALPSVDIDVRGGGELVARHLLDLGHQRIGVIMPKNTADYTSHMYRLEGFRATLDRHGIALSKDCLECADATIEGGYRAAEHLIMLPNRPTAIFATADTMALGALQAAIDSGLRVPADLSLVGFDDIALGACVRPALTTIAIPKGDLASASIELLLRLVEGTGMAREPHPSHVTIHPSLVVRRSTAAIRGLPVVSGPPTPGPDGLTGLKGGA